MDFDQARFNMIEQQIRPAEVLDQHVLDVIGEIHREDFIPQQYRQLALADVTIPLAHNQVTMTPRMEARLLQALDIQKHENILEIGTGCAYLTALLARLGGLVHSIDIYPEFTRQAPAKLQQYGIENVVLNTADALHGWQVEAPYDVIVVTGSVVRLEQALQNQLAVNGRLFIIVGRSPTMEAMLITRVGEENWSMESLFETDVPPLIGAEYIPEFQF